MQEIEYSVKTFNPFDQLNIKSQEGKVQKVLIEKDAAESSSSAGLTLGTTATEDTSSHTEGHSSSDSGDKMHRRTAKKQKAKK